VQLRNAMCTGRGSGRFRVPFPLSLVRHSWCIRYYRSWAADVVVGGQSELTFIMVSVGVDWVVFVNDIDRFSLAGEFDMDSAAAVVGQRRLLHQGIAGAVGMLVRLGRPSAYLRLRTVGANIPQPGAVTVFGVGDGAFGVLESIRCLNGMEDGPCYCPLRLALVSAIQVSTQGMLDRDGLQIIGRVDQQV